MSLPTLDTLIDAPKYKTDAEGNKIRKGKARIKAILKDLGIMHRSTDNVAALTERYNATREGRDFVAPPKAPSPFKTKAKATRATPKKVTPAVSTYKSDNGGTYQFKGNRRTLYVKKRKHFVEVAILDAKLMEWLIINQPTYLERI